MTTRRFRILNVFTRAGDRLSGNPLAVFEDARGMSEAEMRAVARQMNLSETTFVLPAEAPGATARVRIFTPTIEMPFAGHPTLGTAFVVRDLTSARDVVTLEMQAGLVEVRADGDDFTLRTARAEATRAVDATKAEIASMLGLDVDALAGEPLWVDTGAEQLVVPLRSPDDVRAVKAVASLVDRHAFCEGRGEAMAYAWAFASPSEVVARFVFTAHGGVVEDPATGSACANLGGYLLATGAALPIAVVVRQGDAVLRPSDLRLRVDAERRVYVGGAVVELGRGALEL